MEIKDYRQPMVTSIGVILGFLVGFLGQWVTEPNFRLVDSGDYVVFGGSLSGVAMLLLALFRMLSPALTTDVVAHYRRTLALFIGGILTALSSMILSAFM